MACEKALFVKDPDATLDYSVNWADYLNGGTIQDSSWISSSVDITIDADYYTSSKTKVVVSGGIVGETYKLTNRIDYLLDGDTLTDDRTIRITIANR